jgi:predicted hydrocarbon binding protein
MMIEERHTDSTGTAVGIFRTAQGLRVVDSPTRARILTLLGDGELSFDEIVSETERAKSTISVHLREMVADGVLGSRSDPEDGRRKFFFLNSEYLGQLSEAERLDMDTGRLLADYDPESSDLFAFYRAMFTSIRITLLADGINIDPILRSAGTHLGHALSRILADRSTVEVLDALARFWEKHGLGRMEVISLSPIVIEIRDCFECQSLPFLGRPACVFDSGVLTSVFSEHFGAMPTVEETACYAMGDGYCRFVIERTGAPATAVAG